ncbi:putative cysteine-rich receptor-like protein kinase 20 isoform X1 [Typha latifolia]
MAFPLFSSLYRKQWLFLLLFLLIILHTPTTKSQTTGAPALQYCSLNENYTPNSSFKANLDSLFSSLASDSGYPAKAAVGRHPDKVYGLALCRDGLSLSQCRTCLHSTVLEILRWCPRGKSSNIEHDNCYLRYSNKDFFGYSNSLIYGTGGKSKLWIIITTTSLASLFSFSFLCFLWIRRKRRARQKKEKLQAGQQILRIKADEPSRLWSSEKNSSEFSLYDFSHIANATNHFSSENKLGEGGFGPVYKGQLPDGLEIAAKRLGARSGQGLVEFKNEIQVIAKLQHRNLVALLGYCIQEEEKILIYEYMANKSLDFFLFDKSRGAKLDWGKRFRIIEGIAQGVLYLHEHSRLRIIHRDLKASNILLDRDMNPKISDFGMARIFGSNETQANTNRVVGTYGYMSPEYAFGGLFSIKSDVFSFGVLLLEIVSGKRNAGSHQYDNSLNLLGYTWELWEEGKWFELIDASLGDEYDKDEILKCINVALMCVQENAMDRPTMSNAIAMLSGESISLPDPKQPAFFNLTITTEVEESLGLAGTFSVNNVTITAPYGR